jgi:hypothetical protein
MRVGLHEGGPTWFPGAQGWRVGWEDAFYSLSLGALWLWGEGLYSWKP